MEEEFKNYFEWDCIVIGGGPAGVTAATNLKRANVNVLLLESDLIGGQLNNTLEIENYTGFNIIGGEELADKLEEDLEYSQVENYFGVVTNVSIPDKVGDVIKVEVDNGASFTCKTLVVASGTTYRKLGLAREDELAGKGVSYCALCDGAFFQDKSIVVVGSGDSAVEESLYLTRFSNDLTSVIRAKDYSRAKEYLRERLDESSIKTKTSTTITQLQTITNDNNEEELDSLLLSDGTSIPCKGLFVYAGSTPNTEFLNSQYLADSGHLQVNGMDDYSVKGKLGELGIFAAGDVIERKVRQVATAVGDGTVVSKNVTDFLENN